MVSSLRIMKLIRFPRKDAAMSDVSARYVPGRYAAIDIGTVTARLLVADVDDQGQVSEIHRDTAICNLGVGVDKTGRLNPDAIARVGEVVARFVEAIDRLQPEQGAPVPSAR